MGSYWRSLFTIGTLGVLLIIISPLAAWIPHRVFDVSALGAGAKQGWLWVMGVAALGIGLVGWAKARDPLAVFRDSRNRYSVSRLQLFGWSLVILSALVAGAVANHRAGNDAVKALDVTIPPEVLALLGISVGSAAGSELIKTMKSAAPRVSQPAGERFKAPPHGLLAVADRPQVSDLVEAEGTSSPDLIDIGKVQMLFVTAIVLGAYAFQLWEVLGGVSRPTDDVLPFASFPALNEGVTTLLLISHGGYLVNKQVSTTG